MFEAYINIIYAYHNIKDPLPNRKSYIKNLIDSGHKFLPCMYMKIRMEDNWGKHEQVFQQKLTCLYLSRGVARIFMKGVLS